MQLLLMATILAVAVSNGNGGGGGGFGGLGPVAVRGN